MNITKDITKEKQRLFDYLYKVVNFFNKKPNINLVRQQIKEVNLRYNIKDNLTYKELHLKEVNLIPGNSYHIKDTFTYKELHSNMIYLSSSYIEDEAHRYIGLKFRFSYSTDIVIVDITDYFITQAD